MAVLMPVDRLEVDVLVDNASDYLSTVPDFVEREADALWRRGGHELSGKFMCCAAHGLSCLITAHRGGAARSILFDSGPEDDVLACNVARLDADLSSVQAVVLSHGHWDHCGGMLRALDLIREANGGADVPFHGHPRMFGSRAIKQADGQMRLMEDVPSIASLGDHGAAVANSTEPCSILEQMFWISGEIPRVTAFEKGVPGQYRRSTDGGGWELDEAVIDERFVAVNVAGKGLIVFTACSHAGVVNVLTYARECFSDIPVYAVIGGLHLSGASEAVIPQTVDGLKAFDLNVIATAHCTGWRAVTALTNVFGDSIVVPSAVGKRYTF